MALLEKSSTQGMGVQSVLSLWFSYHIPMVYSLSHLYLCKINAKDCLAGTAVVCTLLSEGEVSTGATWQRGIRALAMPSDNTWHTDNSSPNNITVFPQ